MAAAGDWYGIEAWQRANRPELLKPSNAAGFLKRPSVSGFGPCGERRRLQRRYERAEKKVAGRKRVIGGDGSFRTRSVTGSPKASAPRSA